jgi:protein-tyrosine phosphatase
MVAYNIPEVSHIKDGLYIGSSRAMYDPHLLREAGINHIVKLYDADPECPPDFISIECYFEDGGEIPLDLLEIGITFMEQHLKAEIPVLVMCGAGMSRSAAFAMAYLLEKQGYNLRYAWMLIKFHHPIADIAPQLWNFLLKHYQQPYSITEILSRW